MPFGFGSNKAGAYSPAGINTDDMYSAPREIPETASQNKRSFIEPEWFYLMGYIRYICPGQLAPYISPGRRHIIIPVSEICGKGNNWNSHSVKKQNYLIFMLLG